MTRPEFISAARRPSRPILVERKRRRWTRGDVHAMGTAAVEAALCRAGGAMSGADVARLLGCQPKPPKGNQSGAGCKPNPFVPQAIGADLSTAGLLVADIRRLIRPATGSFGRELWGEA